jgi:lipoyl(octanoyl) transferase
VDPDLSRYDTIIPCGLVDVGVTSMTAELGRPVGVPEVAERLLPHLDRLLSYQPYEQSPDLPATPQQLSYAV